MGRDKATLRPAGSGETLSRRTGRLLRATTSPCLEVGTGASGLPCVPDGLPGGGPLAATVSGHVALRAAGWEGPAVVVATDLPNLEEGLLRWLAERPGPLSAVPVSGGVPQPLCARWSPQDLELASNLVAAGERSMMALVARSGAVLVPPSEWSCHAAPESLADADTPGQLASLAPRRPERRG